MNLSELIEPLPPKWTRLLEAIDDEGHRKQYRELLASTQHVRVAYGFPANPPEPLTMEQMKRGETHNAELAVESAVVMHGGKKDGKDWLHLWLDHSPNHSRDLPYFAYSTIMADCWTEDEETDLVAWAWTDPAWPEANLGTAPWRKLWDRVGYIHEVAMESEDDDPSSKLRDFEKPTEPLVLYRGAIASRKRGMAWTTSLERAVWFRNHMSPANGVKRSGPLRQARVYRCVVPPERFYAHFEGRGEDEWVADVRSLQIDDITEEAMQS